MISTRPYLLIAAILGSSLVVAEPPRPGKLPFRAKQDGSVNYRDLLELTKQAPSRDRITDAELAAIKDKHKVEFGREMKKTEKPAMPARGDYYANSTLLTDGTNHTVLPQNSVIALPEKYRHRVIERPRGKLILYPDFFKANRHWLMTTEVKLENATGDEPLSEPLVNSLKSRGLVVVSVLQGSPISVMPPKENLAESPEFTAAGVKSGSGNVKPNKTPSTRRAYNRQTER